VLVIVEKLQDYLLIMVNSCAEFDGAGILVLFQSILGLTLYTVCFKKLCVISLSVSQSAMPLASVCHCFILLRNKLLAVGCTYSIISYEGFQESSLLHA